MKSWKVLLILSVVAAGGFAAYWFWWRKRKTAAAPSLAKQLSPTYSYVPPKQQTVASRMPTGAPKSQPAQKYLNQIGNVAQKAGEKVVNKLAEQAAARVGDAASNAVSGLIDSWTN